MPPRSFKKRIVTVAVAMVGKLYTHSAANLPPEIMLRAMGFAKKTGRPLDDIVALLTDQISLTAE